MNDIINGIGVEIMYVLIFIIIACVVIPTFFTFRFLRSEILAARQEGESEMAKDPSTCIRKKWWNSVKATALTKEGIVCILIGGIVGYAFAYFLSLLPGKY